MSKCHRTVEKHSSSILQACRGGTMTSSDKGRHVFGSQAVRQSTLRLQRPKRPEEMHAGKVVTSGVS